jgi:transketolase
MAMSGLRPVAYTIAPFVTVRCLEQIRVDVCYHEMPVIIVGVGAGLSYASLGGTHHSCEDIALLRALPNMSVVCPADSYETRQALRAALAYERPVYIRLGKKGEPDVHRDRPAFTIGRGLVVREGHDVCLFGTGTIVPVVMAASEQLQAAGLSARVVSLHTVKPLDDDMLSDSAKRFRLIVTVEEHSVIGGLGGAVAEWLADHPQSGTRLIRIGVPDVFVHGATEQDEARAQVGLTADRIAERVRNALDGRDGC